MPLNNIKANMGRRSDAKSMETECIESYQVKDTCSPFATDTDFTCEKSGAKVLIFEYNF